MYVRILYICSQWTYNFFIKCIMVIAFTAAHDGRPKKKKMFVHTSSKTRFISVSFFVGFCERIKKNFWFKDHERSSKKKIIDQKSAVEIVTRWNVIAKNKNKKKKLQKSVCFFHHRRHEERRWPTVWEVRYIRSPIIHQSVTSPRVKSLRRDVTAVS